MHYELDMYYELVKKYYIKSKNVKENVIGNNINNTTCVARYHYNQPIKIQNNTTSNTLSNSTNCLLCLVKNKSISAKPCDHVILCLECYSDGKAGFYIQKCPICSKNITNFEKVI
jgi:hypothetical protein